MIGWGDMGNTTANKRAGRAFQSHIAKTLGGKSVGTIEGQDVEHPLWSVECKKRKAFAGQPFMQQAIRNCPEGKTPIVVVHVTGDRHSDDLVMMRFKDWQDWFGTLAACKLADEVL